jgi:AcrR family transcriptional regulator
MAGGARRNEHVRRAVLDAALRLTAERGFEGASIEGIARTAGTSKQTVYRWWPTKAAILQEAFEELVGSDLDHPDTGDVRADFAAQMGALARFFTDVRFRRPLRGLIGGAQSDPGVAESLFRSLFEPRRRRAVARLVAAQERGELSSEVPPEVLVDTLYGPLYYRLLITQADIDPEVVESVLSIVLDPLVLDPLVRRPAP